MGRPGKARADVTLAGTDKDGRRGDPNKDRACQDIVRIRGDELGGRGYVTRAVIWMAWLRRPSPSVTRTRTNTRWPSEMG